MEGDHFLHINMVLNYVLGVRPTTFNNPILNKIQRAWAWFWITAGVCLILSLFYELNYIQSLKALTENLRITLLITFSFVKYIRIKTKATADLVEHIRSSERYILDKSEDEGILKIYHEQHALNNLTSKFFMIFGYSTLFCFFTYPVTFQLIHPMDAMFDIVDNKTVYRERPLPFGGEFPFDKYKYYNWAFGFHVWTGLYCCGVSVIPDIFYWALMIFGTAQIRILQYRLRNFKSLSIKTAAIKHNISEESVVNTMNEDDYIMPYLTDCIEFHKIIIKYITDLNDTICYLMLIDSGLTSLQIAVIGFGCILSGFSLGQMAGLEYLSWTIAQLFFFYWYANEILLNGLQLPSAIWESDWYNCSILVKKNLLFVLTRAQRPLVLYIGPLYPMSVATMLSILKTAVSYLTLMRQMYMDKDE